MARTENEFADILLRRQVFLQRLSAGEREKFIPFLRKMDRELRKQLEGRDLTAFNRTKLEKLLRSVEAMLDELLGDYQRQMLIDLQEIAEDEAQFNVKALKEAIEYTADLPAATQIRRAVLGNPLSIKSGDLLEPFVKDWTAKETKAVSNSIRVGIFQGQTNAQIVQAIRGTKAKRFTDGLLNTTRRNAATVVHTAVQHAASQARLETFAANESIVKGIRWLSTLDSKTCRTCRSLDRQVFLTGKGPRPPIHPYCRCSFTMEFVDKYKALMSNASRASINGPVNSDLSYYDWLKTQPADFQNAALGPTLGKVFREGRLSSDRFAAMQLDINFAPLTIKEMQALEPLAFKRAGI